MKTNNKILASKTTKVIVLTTAVFTFISFWRAAAVVLGDMGSTVYYIGGIAEQFIGKTAPYFILMVMLFAYGVRAVYIESCGMFTRGGVYRIVKTALGGWFAKISVSALVFDYILTGPISSVSAGIYLTGLINDIFKISGVNITLDKSLLPVLFAVLITIYFWRENVKGIEESSDKAFKIFLVTAVMGIVVIAWSIVTLLLKDMPITSYLPSTKLNLTDESFGWLKNVDWAHTIGFVSILIAFGHSILALSGEETMAQVYREVESPKLKNFKRSALVIFLFTFTITSGISFLQVMLIPDNVRPQYIDNLISGLTFYLYGPEWLKLSLNIYVVIAGVLILSSAVNASIVGANGVLNRMAEDKILTDGFRKLHKKFGTTYRMLNLVAGLQILVIILSRGNIIILGEAYAFGVVWSMTFMAFSMIILRFKDKRPREWKVPLNLKVGAVTLPIGLSLVFLILFSAASINLLTKPVATVSGLIFTFSFFTIFTVSEMINKQRIKKGLDISKETLEERFAEKFLEHFNLEGEDEITAEVIESYNNDRVLVAVRDPNNLTHLQKVLSEVDTDMTDVIVFIGRVFKDKQNMMVNVDLEPDERKLFSEVVTVSENIGKPVIPLIIPTNNAFFSIVSVAHSIKAREMVLGLSAKYRPDVQLEQIALLWGTIQSDEAEKITIRIISADKEFKADL